MSWRPKVLRWNAINSRDAPTFLISFLESTAICSTSSLCGAGSPHLDREQPRARLLVLEKSSRESIPSLILRTSVRNSKNVWSEMHILGICCNSVRAVSRQRTNQALGSSNSSSSNSSSSSSSTVLTLLCRSPPFFQMFFYDRSWQKHRESGKMRSHDGG
jgi:hypothetical protein